MAKILVVGGAGYIGSHMVLALREAGHVPIVLDNLSTGHADATLGETLVRGDIGDAALLEQLFLTHQFDAVMHFAACSQVGESMQDPLKYYANNVAATVNLLQTMHRHGVLRFIFSSTAAVYGLPKQALINEQAATLPINPYGHSKLMLETILRDMARAHDLRYVTLRYFNAAGADPAARLGERHEPETHLIPLILQVASGQRELIRIFGNDYPTADGTCIRDYVHVSDLCQAHRLALEALLAGSPSQVFNLGNGAGYSVAQVIEVARQVTGQPIPCMTEPRRAGDPARLVADSRRARDILGWTPCYDELHTIVSHAWAWEQCMRGRRQRNDNMLRRSA